MRMLIEALLAFIVGMTAYKVFTLLFPTEKK
jgi:hypothetical protein